MAVSIGKFFGKFIEPNNNNLSEVIKEVPKQIKEVSEETVKDMQSAEAAYGKALVNSPNGKKVYVKPETKNLNLKLQNMFCASGVHNSYNPSNGGWTGGGNGPGSDIGGGTSLGSREFKHYEVLPENFIAPWD